jgi:hypothetical protein
MVQYTKQQSTKSQRPFVEPGKYLATITAANEYAIERKASDADPQGWCISMQLRIEDGSSGKDRPILPWDVPIARDWQVGQLLEAVFADLEEGDVDVAELAGKQIVVEIATWEIPEGVAAGRQISFIKKAFKAGTTLDDPAAEAPAGGRLKAAAKKRAAKKQADSQPAAPKRPAWETDELDDSGDVPF